MIPSRVVITSAVVALLLAVPARADAPAGRYTTPQTGTVYDTKTKLTWQQVEDPQVETWADASTYCTSLSLAGGGWRLPAVKELFTLIDFKAVSTPLIDHIFSGTTADVFWSSTPEASPSSVYAWGVHFYFGLAGISDVGNTKRVRCVR